MVLNFGIGAAMFRAVAVATGNSSEQKCHHITRQLRSSHRTTNKERTVQMKTTKNIRNAGFTLVEIMIVVAIIGLLAAIAIPNFVKARATSQANACINNLRQIDAAINQWALENKKVSSDTVTLTDVQPYIKLTSAGALPGCPASGTYKTTTVSTSPSCTLSTTVTPNHVLP